MCPAPLKTSRVLPGNSLCSRSAWLSKFDDLIRVAGQNGERTGEVRHTELISSFAEEAICAASCEKARICEGRSVSPTGNSRSNRAVTSWGANIFLIIPGAITSPRRGAAVWQIKSPSQGLAAGTDRRESARSVG